MLISALILSTNSYAALSFTGGSDTSWSGSGNVLNANPSPGTFTGTGINVPFVEDTAGGTLSISNFANSALNPTTRVSNTLSAGVEFTFTGGTADISLGNTTDSDGGQGASFFNSASITGLAGVSSIKMTVTYNEFLAGRSRVLGNSNDLRGFATLGAVGVAAAGTGLDINDFNTLAVFGQSFGLNALGNFVPGIPSGVPFTSAGGGFSDPPVVNGSDVTFSADRFTGLVSPGGGGLDGDFLFLRAFDADGSGDLTPQDADDFYAKELTFTITPDSGTFEDDTIFTFSFDGQQHANLALVPEPSSVMSLSLAAFAFAMRRKRSES